MTLAVGITGHQRLGTRLSANHVNRTERETWYWVGKAFEQFMVDSSERVTIVSSLAAGADQFLAGIAVRRGAALRVVIPAHNYEATFTTARERERFSRLLRKAASVSRLTFQQPSEHAFLAAGKRVVDTSDTVVAVWDGLRAAGLGGTADIVAYARAQGRPVLHLNPLTCEAIQL